MKLPHKCQLVADQLPLDVLPEDVVVVDVVDDVWADCSWLRAV
jgi:hypothetical protein